jgi:hypothetical protein
MGSLDWGYVSLVLSRPNDVRAVELDDSFLMDPVARSAIDLVRLYQHETGKVPPVEFVQGKFPSLEFDPSIEPKWIAKELRQRKVFSILQGGLLRAGNELQAGFQNDVLDTLERVVNDVRAAQVGLNVRDLQQLGPQLRQFYEDVKQGKFGIEMPWPTLNQMTRGLWPETLTFFLGRPAVGKTFLSILVARHAHLMGKRVLIISPEMNAMEVGERFFAVEAKVSYSDVVSGSLSQLPGEDGRSAEEKYFEALESRTGDHGGPYILDEEDQLTDSALETMVAKIGPDIVAIDAAYLLPIGKGNRYERIISIVGWMRHLSKVFHVPVVASSQLNKEAEKKGQGASMGSTAMSDTINWDAHNLFGLEQTPEMRDDGRLSIIPMKVRRRARMYAKAKIDIHWDMDRMNFDEIDTSEGKEFKDEGFEDTAF